LENTLYVNSSPHVRSEVTTQRLMLDVIIALIPAAFAGIYFFGLRAALLIAVTVVSSVGFEYITRKALKRNNTIGDFSAAVTGLILALNLPPSLPLWMAMVGSLFAIIIVKQLFGGLGQNFVNPALAARAFLIVSYGARMTTWTQPLLKASDVDALSYATPLGTLKGGGELPRLIDMFIGNIGGSLGETSTLALIIGGIYLLARGVITWHIPVVYVGTVGLFAWVIGPGGIFTGNPLFHILAGGLMFGAIFMATDYTTSPMTKKGAVIYAFGCGLLTMLFRLFTNMPEGVSYAILLMNVAVPMIDRYAKPARFGGNAHV
jgi:electron transport complex protein RnfD